MNQATTIVVWVLISSTAPALEATNAPNLSFEGVIHTAIEQDPWLDGSIHQEQALTALSVAAGELPDPQVSIGVANLATDTFEFNQEAMTHFKLGISQQFPRGQSRQLKQTQLSRQSQQYRWLRADRIGQITVQVGGLWLDLFEAQESMRLINNSRKLFENLVDVAQSTYRSAWSKTKQLDIIQAQLELSVLDDRLTVLAQNQQMHMAQMSQWLGHPLGSHLTTHDPLPKLEWVSIEPAEPADFMQHPVVLALDTQIDAQAVGIQLAEQNFKPAWSVNLGYGLRHNDPMGMDRADLLSVGVQFDVPIFTANRQDQKLAAAVSSHSALLTEKETKLRQLMASSATSAQTLVGLQKRVRLYQEDLIPQINDSVEVALQAYASDEGTFNDVIRAQISALDADLQLLKIQVAMQKSILQHKYAHLIQENPLLTRGVKP